MKKKTIKTMLLLTAICLLSLSMIGCSKRICEQCNEKKSCSKYIIKYDGDAEEGYMCSDCYEKMKEKYEAIGGSVEKE